MLGINLLYSKLTIDQGAQVAADVLCGTSETGFATTQPVASDNGTTNPHSECLYILADEYLVAAVILMGDPSHTPAGTFNNGGTAQNDGVCLPNPSSSQRLSYFRSPLVADTYFSSASLVRISLDAAQLLPVLCRSAIPATHSAIVAPVSQPIWDMSELMEIRRHSSLSMLCRSKLDDMSILCSNYNYTQPIYNYNFFQKVDQDKHQFPSDSL